MKDSGLSLGHHRLLEQAAMYNGESYFIKEAEMWWGLRDQEGSLFSGGEMFGIIQLNSEIQALSVTPGAATISFHPPGPHPTFQHAHKRKLPYSSRWQAWNILSGAHSHVIEDQQISTEPVPGSLEVHTSNTH